MYFAGVHAPRLGTHLDEGFTRDVSAGIAMDPEQSDLVSLDWREPLRDVKYDTWRHTGKRDVYEGNVSLKLQDTLITADRLTRDMEKGEVLIEGNVRVQGELSTLTADAIRYRFPTEDRDADDSQPFQRGSVTAERIHLIEPNRELTAGRFEYDLATHTGSLTEAKGRSGPLYYRAKNFNFVGMDDMTGEDVWITTCERDPPHYKLRIGDFRVRDGDTIQGKRTRLQFGNVTTPVYIPRFTGALDRDDRPLEIDLTIGREGGIGEFINLGLWHSFTPNLDLGLRLFPTAREGFGYGIDSEYNFLENPDSALYGTRGSLRTLYTTQERGYVQYYHRQPLGKRTVALGQVEQWSDEDFIDDFFHNDFRGRTGPRTFLNLTHTTDGQLLTATVFPSTHDFAHGTEKLPELTYHLLERNLFQNVYFSFESVNGYYERAPSQVRVSRYDQVARLSYDLKLNEGINLTPFVQGEGTWYSELIPSQEGEAYRLSALTGATLQTRLQRTYKGILGYSGFKHVIMPSVTYLYRPDATEDIRDVFPLDALDNRPARSRIEGMFDTFLLARDRETDEVWQVLRVSLFVGRDTTNEINNADDYEVNFRVMPRPNWGVEAIAERSQIGPDPFYPATRQDRIAANIFQEGERWNGRIGYNFIEPDGQILNQEIVYGIGYRLTDRWSAAIQHRYDLDRDEIDEQTYEIKRRLHRWETTLRLRDRDSSFDVNFNVGILYRPISKKRGRYRSDTHADR